VTRRALKRLGVVLLVLAAGVGAVVWLVPRTPLDLRPQAERLLKSTEADVPTLLRETALNNNWSSEELRAEILARRIGLGDFVAWVTTEPLEVDSRGARPRRRLVATARFQKVEQPVPVSFRFIHRPGGWVLGDFDVPLPQLTSGPARPELGRKAVEEVARLVLSRQTQDLHLRLGRRERRSVSLEELAGRVRPPLEGLGRFEKLEVASFEPLERGYEARVTSADEAGRAVEVKLQVEFEHTSWVVRRVQVDRT
jgi:hypothetical protein